LPERWTCKKAKCLLTVQREVRAFICQNLMTDPVSEKIKRDLVEFGIIDKKGNYTAPYRND